MESTYLAEKIAVLTAAIQTRNQLERERDRLEKELQAKRDERQYRIVLSLIAAVLVLAGIRVAEIAGLIP